MHFGFILFTFCLLGTSQALTFDEIVASINAVIDAAQLYVQWNLSNVDGSAAKLNVLAADSKAAANKSEANTEAILEELSTRNTECVQNGRPEIESILASSYSAIRKCERDAASSLKVVQSDILLRIDKVRNGFQTFITSIFFACTGYTESDWQLIICLPYQAAKALYNGALASNSLDEIKALLHSDQSKIINTAQQCYNIAEQQYNQKTDTALESIKACASV